MSEPTERSESAAGGQLRLVTGLLVLIAALLAFQIVGPMFGMVQWEYRIESPDDFLFDTQMNQLGRDGWELVFARRATSSSGGGPLYEMIFKRQRRLLR